MGLPLSAHATDWREGRRLRAYELHAQGWSQKQIADALGVTPGLVHRLGRDHLSVIGAVGLDGKLYFHVYEAAITRCTKRRSRARRSSGFCGTCSDTSRASC